MQGYLTLSFLALVLAFPILAAGCGESKSECPPEMVKCGNECVATSEDRSHCGRCGNLCLAGTTCVGGYCVNCVHECEADGKKCIDGQAHQFMECGDPDLDTCREWEGAQTCPGDRICQGGECVPACASDCDPGGRECYGDGFRECGNYDADECLEWSGVTACAAGENCDLQSGQCVCQGECQPAGDRRCAPPPANGYDICGNWDADACLEWGARYDCPAGQTCSQGECSLECKDDCQRGQQICDGNGYRVCDYYDADPCLDWSGITSCLAYESCDLTSGKCLITCQDECGTPGDRRCSGDGYDVCGNYDIDPCLEWGAHLGCQVGTKCSGGACVEDCRSECNPAGIRMCDGSGYRVCDQYDTDSCLEWSPILPCGTGEVCNDGTCARACQNECAIGERECFEKGFRECGQYDPDQCLDWSGVTACADWEICDQATANCIANCLDQCDVPLEQQCSRGGYVVCGNWDADPCLEWSGVKPCPIGKVCSLKTNDCVDDCQNECQTVDQRQCAGDGYDICGNWDIDSCLEWGGHTACATGWSCSGGQCVENCTNDCDLEGRTVCEGTIGYRYCGHYDGDSCLDLSGVTYCAENQECQAGSCVKVCDHECVVGERRCLGDQAQVCGQFDTDPCYDWGAQETCGAGEICYRGQCISATPATVLVNEVLYDDAGIDGEFEFIELWGPAGASLDNFAVLGISGADGDRYLWLELDGYVLPLDEHLVIATSIADPTLAAERDLTQGSGNLLQNDHENLQVVYAGTLVVDALAYGDFSGGGVFAGEGDPAPGARYDSVNRIMYCLSRGADHADSGNNFDDFYQRTTCTPGWEGPGAVLWREFVYGGTSTPAIDSAGNIYTVDAYGWPTLTSPQGIRQYNVWPDADLRTSLAISWDEQTLFAGTDDGLYALEASTGYTVFNWQPPAQGIPVYSSPALGSDGTIYFGSRGGGFYAANPDGSVKWNYPAAGWVDSSPALGFIGPLGEEFVVFGVGGLGGMVVAIDTGVDPLNVVPVWARTAGGGCNSSPAIGSDGVVYIGCDDGLLYGFDGATGALLPAFPVSLAIGTVVDSPLVEGCSAAVVPLAGGGDLIYMTSHAQGTGVGNLYLYRSDGLLGHGWILPDPYVSSATVGADGSYLVHDGDLLLSFSPVGLLEWGAVFDVGISNWMVSSPAVDLNGGVYVLEEYDPAAFDGGYLYKIQGASGLSNGPGSFPKFRGDLPNSGWGY